MNFSSRNYWFMGCHSASGLAGLFGCGATGVGGTGFPCVGLYLGGGACLRCSVLVQSLLAAFVLSLRSVGMMWKRGGLMNGWMDSLSYDTRIL
jgi:hypothetical protein